MVGNRVKLVNSIRMGALKDFVGCEVRFSDRSNAVWDKMTMDNTLCKSMDGS